MKTDRVKFEKAMDMTPNPLYNKNKLVIKKSTLASTVAMATSAEFCKPWFIPDMLNETRDIPIAIIESIKAVCRWG